MAKARRKLRARSKLQVHDAADAECKSNRGMILSSRRKMMYIHTICCGYSGNKR
jgi:hypothetical protein